MCCQELWLKPHTPSNTSTSEFASNCSSRSSSSRSELKKECSQTEHASVASAVNASCGEPAAASDDSAPGAACSCGSADDLTDLGLATDDEPAAQQGDSSSTSGSCVLEHVHCNASEAKATVTSTRSAGSGACTSMTSGHLTSLATTSMPAVGTSSTEAPHKPRWQTTVPFTGRRGEAEAQAHAEARSEPLCQGSAALQPPIQDVKDAPGYHPSVHTTSSDAASRQHLRPGTAVPLPAPPPRHQAAPEPPGSAPVVGKRPAERSSAPYLSVDQARSSPLPLHAGTAMPRKVPSFEGFGRPITADLIQIYAACLQRVQQSQRQLAKAHAKAMQSDPTAPEGAPDSSCSSTPMQLPAIGGEKASDFSKYGSMPPASATAAGPALRVGAVHAARSSSPGAARRQYVSPMQRHWVSS